MLVKRIILAASLLAFLAIPLAPRAAAQSPPPNLVHFQARLANGSGVPISGPVNVQVAVYDVAVGGAPLWSESQSTTALNGVVNLLLGTFTSIPGSLFDSGNRYLGLTVGADSEMSPRLPLASTPFALRSAKVAAIDANTTIGTGLIDTTHILDGTVAEVDLANGAVSSAKLAGGAVGAAALANGAVTAPAIADGAIATNHLSSGAVTEDKIALGAVDTLRIADGSVTASKLAAAAVTGIVIAAGTIDSPAIASFAITADKIASGAVDGTKIASNSIDGSKIVNGAVDSSKLAANAVDSSKITNNAIDSSKLADGAVLTTKLAAGAVTTGAILDGTILAADIAALAVTGDRIAPNAIDNSKLADGAVGASKIGNGAVGNAALADGAVGATKLASPVQGPGSVAPVVLVEATANTATAAVRGVASALAGPTAGIDGQSFSSAGTGVRASALSLTGTTYGVFSQVASPNGFGVYGNALAGTGGVGVYGATNSTAASAMGVQGVISSTAPGNLSAAVRGENKGTGSLGVGVWGSHAGNGFGVYGTVTGGVGVLGYANGASGTNYGVFGQSSSATGYGVYSSGNSATTGTKSFIQPDPKNPANELHFVCLEGNESGTYFRGSSKLENGVATITVPAEFRGASEEDGVTVQLTPVGGRAVLWVLSQDSEKIVVQGDADVAFHYWVNGVRRGFAGHQVVRPNESFVPVLRGVPFGAQYPESLRKVLVANGILNADYTPNEETAARMGWKLQDPIPNDPRLPVAAPAGAQNGGR